MPKPALTEFGKYLHLHVGLPLIVGRRDIETDPPYQFSVRLR